MNGKLLRFHRAGTPAPSPTPPTGEPEENGLSSEALVTACATGDSAALGELFDRFHCMVYRVLSRYLGPHCADLDDLVQATFLEVRRAAANFRHDSAAKSWIIGIAINIGRHYVRGEARRQALLHKSCDIQTPNPGNNPETDTEQHEILVRVQRAIVELPEHLRTAFVLCELEEMPGPEAAQLLNLPKGTLWRRLHDARKLIRQAIRRTLP